MESVAEMKQSSASSKKIIIIAVVAILIAIIVAAVAVFYALSGRETDGLSLTYANEASVMLDQDSLQAAVDAAQKNAKEGKVALEYKNNAYSTDGKTFSCYIVNSASNLYDMFLTIFADDALTDQVFLSGLIPPGSGLEEITLDHELDPGDHTVYIAVTQVDTDENGAQVIKNQVMHTIEFHVE